MSKRHEDGRVHTAFRIPPETHEKLKHAAKERGLSVNYLILKAIEDLLDRLIPVEELKLTRSDQ